MRKTEENKDNNPQKTKHICPELMNGSHDSAEVPSLCLHFRFSSFPILRISLSPGRCPNQHFNPPCARLVPQCVALFAIQGSAVYGILQTRTLEWVTN